MGRAIVTAAAMAAASSTCAQQLIIYPAKGQSPQQQARDQGERHVCATQSTGIDPAKLTKAPAEVDRLREVAGKLMRQSEDCQQVVRDMGGKPAK